MPTAPPFNDDRGVSPIPGDATPAAEDAEGLPDGAVPRTDSGPETFCQSDGDCGERAWCDAEGRCIPTPEAFRPDAPLDGVTRAGAARFDLTPDAFETWLDNAGPDCPDNRAGRYDGNLYTAKPMDPCQDGFDDFNANGFFDAVWLAGDGLDRPANGVEERNAPAGRVVVLSRDETVQVIISLDLFAIDAARLAELSQRLQQRLGLSPTQLTVHTTGVRSAPDAVGLWGPSLAIATQEAGAPLAALDKHSLGLLADIPVRSGVNQRWWNQVVDRCLSATRQAAVRVTPVQVQSGAADLPIAPTPSRDGPIELPDVNDDGVLNDQSDRAAWAERKVLFSRSHRIPERQDRTLRVIALQAPENRMQRVVFVGWGAAPTAVRLKNGLLSADFPGEVRQIIERRYPQSVAVWMTSASPDTLRAGGDAFVPTVSDIGQPVNREGDPVEHPFDAEPAADPSGALGHLLAHTAIKALAGVDPVPGHLAVDGRYAWVPISNPRFGLAARLGLLGPLGDWLMGRVSTEGWASAEVAPSCGGLGCLRYRVDRIQLSRNLALLTMPGAPFLAYAVGRPQSSIDFGDGRNLRDLDGDGMMDSMDEELVVGARVGEAEVQVTFSGAANPQRFDAIRGLGSDGVWVVGRTNGGVGSMGPSREHINVFEGQLDALYARLDDPQLADLSLQLVGYSPAVDFPVSTLVDFSFDGSPARLANVPTSFELLLARTMEFRSGLSWRLEDAMGSVRTVDDEEARGDDLVLGPGATAYSPNFNFAPLDPLTGDRLFVGDEDEPLTVQALRPIVLRTHPNAGDAWHAIAPDGGDLVYNTACELLFEGACPNRVEVSPDPNARLPRTP